MPSKPLYEAIAPGKLPLVQLAEVRGDSLACEMAGHLDVVRGIVGVLYQGL